MKKMTRRTKQTTPAHSTLKQEVDVRIIIPITLKIAHNRIIGIKKSGCILKILSNAAKRKHLLSHLYVSGHDVQRHVYIKKMWHVMF